MKKKITESQLRNIIAESVKKILKEAYNPQDDIDAKEFMSWAMNSRSDVMQNIYGYYQASREGNESNANWYMDKILFAYADEKGCEESQLNTNAIEKAINEWGYYNYHEDDLLNEAYDSFIDDTIGREISEIESNVDVLAGKLGIGHRYDGTYCDEPTALQGHSSKIQIKGAMRAVKDIKRACFDLRHCTMSY